MMLSLGYMKSQECKVVRTWHSVTLGRNQTIESITAAFQLVPRGLLVSDIQVADDDETLTFKFREEKVEAP